MKALIITQINNNRGEVVDLFFTDSAYHYADAKGLLYMMNDFVELGTIDHEQKKALKMVKYWVDVVQTIAIYKSKERAENEKLKSDTYRHNGFGIGNYFHYDGMGYTLRKRNRNTE